MDASLIISAYNRPHVLDWQLQSILKQKCVYEFEVLLFNDGIRDNGVEQIYDKYKNLLNIKYVWSGQRHTDGKLKQWRHWGWTFNMGAQLARGNTLMGVCDSVFLLDNVIEQMVKESKKQPKCRIFADKYYQDDHNRIYPLFEAQSGDVSYELVSSRGLGICGTSLFFLWCIGKDYFVSIGGIDEDFTGRGYDDDDLAGRLDCDKVPVILTQACAVHLWHDRSLSHYTNAVDCDEAGPNKKLMIERKGIIVRNTKRTWGILPDEYKHLKEK